MGFFEDVTGGGGAIASIAGGIAAPIAAPLGIAAAGAGALGIDVGDLFGVGAQTSALGQAAGIEQQAEARAAEFQRQALEAGAPARAASVGAIGQLQERAAAPLGESLAFQQALQSGLAQQQAGLARFGLGESSVAGVGAGQLTQGLLAQDEATRLAIQSQLAGGALTGFGPAVGGLQLGSQLAGQRAQTVADIGATKAAGKQAGIQTALDIAGLFVGGIGGGL